MNIPVVITLLCLHVFVCILEKRGLRDAVHAGQNGLWGVAGAAAVA